MRRTHFFTPAIHHAPSTITPILDESPSPRLHKCKVTFVFPSFYCFCGDDSFRRTSCPYLLVTSASQSLGPGPWALGLQGWSEWWCDLPTNTHSYTFCFIRHSIVKLAAALARSSMSQTGSASAMDQALATAAKLQVDSHTGASCERAERVV